MWRHKLTILQQQGAADYLIDIVRGIEKESLRVTAEGKIAQTNHPAAFGSAFAHPSITTDFSESLLELITPPVKTLEALEQHLSELHCFASQSLQHEYLWPASMPGWVSHESEIRLAKYGTSHAGQMMHVYRQGLANRYGRLMQAIAGIHYNFSFPETLLATLAQAEGTRLSTEYRSSVYFGVIRNYFRHYWLLAYLFGASPACMASSLPGKPPEYLTTFDQRTYFSPTATCLRMSGLGYHNSAQHGLKVCLNTLNNYVDSLITATQTPYSAFTDLGVCVHGEYRQLNDSILQIENEYYSPIRPKAVPPDHERPSLALKRLGVQYLEVRVLDLNPLLMLGIDRSEMAFIDVFLTYCLLLPKESICFERTHEARSNFARMAIEGRKPDMQLHNCGKLVRFKDWARSVFDDLQCVAEWMDSGKGVSGYSKAVEQQLQKIADVEKTPSAQVLSKLSEYQYDYPAFCLDMAKKYHKDALAKSLPVERQVYYAQLAAASLAAQHDAETHDTGSFSAYLQRYFSQGSL